MVGVVFEADAAEEQGDNACSLMLVLDVVGSGARGGLPLMWIAFAKK